MKRRIFISIFFVFLFLLLIFRTCNHKQQNDSIKNISLSENDSILITYFCGEFDSSHAKRCESLAEIQGQHLKNRYDYAIPAELKDVYFEDSSVLYGVKLEMLPPQLIDTFIVDIQVIDIIKELLYKRIPVPDYSDDARMYVTIKYKDRKSDHLCFDNYFSKNRVKHNGKACHIDDELFFLLRYYSGYYLWFGKSELKDFKELNNPVFYRKMLDQKEQNSDNPFYVQD